MKIKKAPVKQKQQLSPTRKKYNTASDIIGSPEFKEFQEKIYKIEPNDNSIMAKIAKKKGIKLEPKWKIDLSRNIMMDVNEFYYSPENELKKD